MDLFRKLAGAFFCLSCFSCRTDVNDKSLLLTNERQSASVKPYEVSVMELRYGTFNKEIVCNGHLEATRKVDIISSGYGILEKVNVTDGDYVNKGDVIASIGNAQAGIGLRRAQLAYDRAVVSMNERMLDYGYSVSDVDMVPEQQMKLIQIMSGFADAQINLEQAEKDFEECDIRAPFGGVIANLDCQEYDVAQNRICTLIDVSRYKVLFNILETEYPFIRKGAEVLVIPYYDSNISFKGKIISVNPIVGDNGQISVVAEIPGSLQLMGGMSVKVILRNSVPDVLVVPKNAVLCRDGQDVVFLFQDGKCVWTYVNVLLSNGTEYAIEADPSRDAVLREGDMVIVEGNLNLSDNSEVMLRQ